MSEIRAVRFSDQPIQGESLPGFITRIAAENVLGNTRHIFRSAGYRSDHRPGGTSLRDHEHIPRLSAVLKVRPEALAPLLNSGNESGLAHKWRSFGGSVVLDLDLSYRYRRWSSLALSRAPFDRMAWAHQLTPYCIETGELLVELCPRCSKRLRWGKVVAIDQCEHCEADLKAFPAAIVDSETRRRINPLLALINPDPRIHEPASSLLDHRLRDLDRGIAFELAIRLSALCDVPGNLPVRSKLKTLPLPQKLAFLSRAASILRSWPDEWHREIHDTVHAIGILEAAQRFQGFRDGVSRGTFPAGLRPALEKHIPEIVNSKPSFYSTLKFFPTLIGVAETQKRLGLRPKEFAALHQAGFINAKVSATRGHRISAAFEAAEIDVLANNLRDRVDVATVAEKIGSTHAAVDQLVALGLVTEVDHPIVKAHHKRKQILPSSFELMLQKLHSNKCTMREPTISLRALLQGIGGREKPIGPIFREMLGKALPYSIEPRGKMLIDQVHIPKKDAARVRKMHFDENSARFKPEMRISQRDAIIILNITPPAMSVAMNSIFVAYVHDDKKLDRDAVLNVAMSRISRSEINSRWIDDLRQISPDFSVINLPKIDALGRDRAAVEAYFGDSVDQEIPSTA